jgi:hypothetical protein
MKKRTTTAIKMYSAGALLCAATLFAATRCEDDVPEAPGAAGSITSTGIAEGSGGNAGATTNNCPEATVSLSVGEVKHAASYQWYKDGEKIPNATGATYTATESGSYTVAGVNGEGEGAKSPAHVVTIVPCAGTEGGVPDAAGTIGSATDCSLQQVSLSVPAITGATSYVWKIARADNDFAYDTTAVPADTVSLTFGEGLSATFTVWGLNAAGNGAASQPHVVAILPCPDDGKPAAAGAISGSTTNECPSQLVSLSVPAITGATSYVWKIAFAADDFEYDTTAVPTYTYNFSTFGEGQHISFTVWGLNEVGNGAASQPHEVTKQLCLAAKPVIQGKDEWKVMRGDTAVYTIVCPATNMPATASTESGSVIRYKWYWQQLGEHAELVEWTTDGAATYNLGSPGNYTYNFAVSAITADGESPKSDVIQVVGVACCQPNSPGGAAGNVAMYPENAYPQGAPYSFEVSNCDIQEKTGKAETGVTLICNNAIRKDDAHPVTGYSFWVKTATDDDFHKVVTTGTAAAERRIFVDGTTYPAGTYKVTAESSCGDSPFGNNEITVVIRNDCPAPAPTLSAPTFDQGSGGVITNGVFSNTCPTALAPLYLTIPSAPAGSTLTKVKWTRVSPTPEAVVWESTTNETIRPSVANNGTYSVTYTKDVEGTSYESEPGTLTINVALCPPTFATKPEYIIEPAEYAVAVLNAPNAGVDGITYEWFYNNSTRPASSLEVSLVDGEPLTFHLLKEGTYKVRIRTSYGNSDYSEEISLVKVTTPTAYTRDDIIGTYSVTDWKGNNAATANNYTLTIAADTHADSITITNLGNVVGTGNYPIVLKAAVSFNAAVGDDGIYGTITIPKQSYNIPEWTYNFRKVTTMTNPPSFSDDPVVIDIKYVGGKPGVSQTGVRYLLARGTSTAIGSVFGGGTSKTTTWTKQ